MTGNASGPFRLNMNAWARGGNRNHAATINAPFVTRTIGISQGGLTTRRYSSATARRNPGTASMNTSWRSARRRRGPRHLFLLREPGALGRTGLSRSTGVAGSLPHLHGSRRQRLPRAGAARQPGTSRRRSSSRSVTPITMPPIPARTSCYSTPYCVLCARTVDDAGAAQALMKLHQRDRCGSTHLELDVNAEPWPFKEAPSR